VKKVGAQKTREREREREGREGGRENIECRMTSNMGQGEYILGLFLCRINVLSKLQHIY
jgi:hypothetical protein